MFRKRFMPLLATAGLFVLGGYLSAQQVDPAAARRQLLEALQNRGENETVQILPVQPETAEQIRGRQILPGSPDEAPRYRPVDRHDVVEEVVDAFEGPPPAPETSTRMLQYEVTILHLASPRDFSSEESDVTGDNVAERIAQWNEQGKVAHASTIRFSSTEDQAAFVQLGEQVPVVTGTSSFGGRGPVQSQVNYQETGTIVGATGRIEGDRVLLEIDVEQSRLEPSETPLPPVDEVEEADAAAAAPGGGSPGDPLFANQSSGRRTESAHPTTRQFKTQTTVTVPDGGTAILSASFQKTDAGSRGTVVTLRATIGD